MSKLNSLTLIGMPGSGKSTVGVIVAKLLAKEFVDTDILIQTACGEPLQDILDRDGYLQLRSIEESLISDLQVLNSVVATGGSAVYGERAMAHLKASSTVIWLKTSIDLLFERITNFETRGIAKAPGQSFEDLFIERERLYAIYADAVVDTAEGNFDTVAQEIVSLFSKPAI